MHFTFLNAGIQHIGSTFIEGLSTKPIIDIFIDINNEEDFEKGLRQLHYKISN